MVIWQYGFLIDPLVIYEDLKRKGEGQMPNLVSWPSCGTHEAPNKKRGRMVFYMTAWVSFLIEF